MLDLPLALALVAFFTLGVLVGIVLTYIALYRDVRKDPDWWLQFVLDEAEKGPL